MKTALPKYIYFDTSKMISRKHQCCLLLIFTGTFPGLPVSLRWK